MKSKLVASYKVTFMVVVNCVAIWIYIDVANYTATACMYAVQQLVY